MCAYKQQHVRFCHSSAMSGKRKVLTLQDRVKVIERNGKGDSARAIAISLGCGKTQIQSIIKDKEKIMQVGSINKIIQT